MANCLPSKQKMRVRFPLSATSFLNKKPKQGIRLFFNFIFLFSFLCPLRDTLFIFSFLCPLRDTLFIFKKKKK